MPLTEEPDDFAKPIPIPELCDVWLIGGLIVERWFRGVKVPGRCSRPGTPSVQSARGPRPRPNSRK